MTNVVCDNTMSAALKETGPRLKVRHSRNSLGRLGEVRDALGIVHSVADQFAAQVAELCRLHVSDVDWRRFLNAHAPIPDRMPAPRAKTLAAAKRVALDRLWNHDARVAPWGGTAWGASSRPSTPTPTTNRPSAAPTAPNATCSAPSKAAPTASTAAPSAR